MFAHSPSPINLVASYHWDPPKHNPTIRPDTIQPLLDNMANTQSLKADTRNISALTIAHPFRLLDLPKELRLMIYEQLPTKTTRRHIPNQAPIVVHITLPGVELLATCRQIRSEAITILSNKLTAIASQPARIIVPKLYDDNLRALLFAAANKISINGSFSSFPLDCSNSHIQQVCIAVLDNTPRTILEENLHTFSQLAGFRKILEPLHPRIIRALDIQVRPVLMSGDKRVAYYRLPPGDIVSYMWRPCPDSRPEPLLRVGGGIGEEEWEKDWKEGERLDP